MIPDDAVSVRQRVPALSFFFPAHNEAENIEAFVAEALEMLPTLAEEFEIIAIDDGSKDATVEIARQFEPRGVRVISQPNQGASAARNNAFSQCHGDYIQWLDADDLLAPDKIAKDLAFFDAMLAKIQADYSVDPRRIYVIGMSNGGRVSSASNDTMKMRNPTIWGNTNHSDCWASVIPTRERVPACMTTATVARMSGSS